MEEQMTRTLVFSKITKVTILAPALALAAACGGSGDEPKLDDALRSDLSLATQAQQYRPQQFVSPQELGYQAQPPYGQPLPYGAQPMQAGYAAGPYYAPQAAPAPQPVRERVVYRTRTVRSGASRSSSGGGGGGYSSGGTYSSAGSVDDGADERRAARAKGRTNGAIIGSVAGAAVGVATSGRKDRVKGGLIGAVAGAGLGTIIGNNTAKRP
jgi:hypothetical protein